ncbi:SURF1-like protein [Plasmodiophora brassicae]
MTMAQAKRFLHAAVFFASPVVVGAVIVSAAQWYAHRPAKLEAIERQRKRLEDAGALPVTPDFLAGAAEPSRS